MSIEKEAADWFARLRGPDGDRLRASFVAWYADPVHAAAYDHLARSWDQAKFLANTATGQRRNLNRARIDHGYSVRTIALVASILLSIALGASLIGRAAWSLREVRPDLTRTEVIAATAPRMLRLVDGSRVILDRGSRLAIAFSGVARRLHLLTGRARFDVSHDPLRPFVVDAGGGSVIAHGTMFDVALAPEGIEILLLRGAVEVRDGAAGDRAVHVRHLIPGQKVMLVGGTLTEPVAASALDTRWPEAMIEFDAMPLDTAVAAFNRGGVRPIHVEGVEGRHFLVTGAFRRDDPEEFAATLAATFDLAVRSEGRADLVIAPRASSVVDPKKP
ncbi:FecR family protein [Sphingomonas sp. ERG5]|uniref:FecR family protein n=1 Tax=Sphingomonas sp. ERG5 TaxID=1381597 RepID=UPI000B10CE07|nr:FecR domain-containing protein [Sphingomonas sp. ERG5]